MASFFLKIRAILKRYAQALFIAAAFALMVVSSYLYVRSIMPEDRYYQETKNLAIMLTILGTILSGALIMILLRISAEKNKADERVQSAVTQMNLSRQALNILENILNGLDALIYVTVPETGEILFINNYMKEHYHVAGEDYVGQLCYKVFQKERDDKCDFCPCHQLDREPHSTVIWEEHNTLVNRIFRNTDRYIEWPDGRTVHIQHAIDVTELISAKEQAVQANKEKSSFLAKMSHEIRTPMNAILGITEIQLQNEGLPPDMREALDRIFSSGYLLLGIVNDILDLSKIEAGKLTLAPVKYNVASLINDVMHLSVTRFENKAVEFILQVDENIPSSLFGDDLRIKQILNNLLSNAFKYTDSGTVSLLVAFENEPAKDASQITLVLRVSDTGQGMSAEQVDRLFDEYTRFNTEVNRITEGTGLGMSITKHLVTLMNGEITVESEPSKGSVFTVRLPQEIADNGILGAALAENLRQFRLGKTPQIVREYMPYGKVLVVDDIETNLYVARGLMAPYGLSVETAASGYKAVEMIKSGSFYDIIFMDHFMPGMDGTETTKMIRGLGYTHAIIALTANVLAGQAEIFLANGFDWFISKPIDTRQLNAALNKFIRDKYPPEVVKAARRYEAILAKPKEQPLSEKEIAAIFADDAEKAIAVLEPIHANNYRRNDDVQLYFITVHALKSALANIGEMELFASALNLERAGREGNIAEMIAGTPVFLDALRKLIKKNKPHDEDEEEETVDDIQDNEREHLHIKLHAIHMACTAYDKRTANEALIDLREKKWPHSVKELLDTIARHVLHSEFEEIVSLIEASMENLV
jgi:signal transduction histidine kinase/CheY-like chemotaxis protein/HPt (histidine-containing phosphotransfer) domain-containing protein